MSHSADALQMQMQRRSSRGYLKRLARAEALGQISRSCAFRPAWDVGLSALGQGTCENMAWDLKRMSLRVRSGLCIDVVLFSFFFPNIVSTT